MAVSDTSRSHTLIPSFIYTSSLQQNERVNTTIPTASASSPLPSSFMIPAPSEPAAGKIKMFSPAYYAACTVSGGLCCGLTHMAMTPLDLVKCNMQLGSQLCYDAENTINVAAIIAGCRGYCKQQYCKNNCGYKTMIDPLKYKSVSSGFGILYKEQGLRGFFRGWAPTLLGYTAQGAFKYGLYEYFKKYYSDVAGPEFATKYKTLIYLAGSASSEFIADIALCPFEAVKVRIQTQPGFARGLSDGLPKLLKSEGALGLYKGIVPLWGRQIPYTMMKFASYENTVELIYKHAIPTPKDDCSKPVQLGVSFAGGYIAGILCTLVSHPADNLVSFMNNSGGATVSDAVKKLGLWGLATRGLPLRIFMIGTLTGAQWLIYDSFKVFVGLPTTGGAAPVPAAVPAPAYAN